MLEIIHFSPFFIVVKDPHYNLEFYFGGGPHSYIQLSGKKKLPYWHCFIWDIPEILDIWDI